VAACVDPTVWAALRTWPLARVRRQRVRWFGPSVVSGNGANVGRGPRNRSRAWFVACVAAAGLVVAPGAPAAAAPNCAEPGTAYAPVPWPQRMFDIERAWALTRGANVTVAVLDSGVDANHPQLRGRVAAGTDVIETRGDGRTDCAGRGTQTAGII